MKKKKILFIEANTDSTIGGSHYCLLELVKNLTVEKYSPHVIFFRDNPLVAEFGKFSNVSILPRRERLNLAEKERVWRLFEKIPLGSKIGRGLQKIYNFFCHFLFEILRNSLFLRKAHVDIVHLNNGPLQVEWFLACRISGVKCIAHIRGTFRDKNQYMGKDIIPHFDALIPISEAVYTYMRKLGLKLPKMYLINDGIDISSVEKKKKKHSNRVRSEFQDDITSPLVGVVNNIKDWKGQHVAIEALGYLKPRYPDIKCLFIGNVSDVPCDQEYFEHLVELTKSLGLEKNVLFTGFRSDVIDLICALDIVLHTSMANEGFPRVILETMTMAKPLIASGIGPNCEMVDNGINGFLFEPGNSRELAEKIEKILLEPGLGAEMGKKAREKVELNYDIAINVNKTEAIYEELLFRPEKQ